MAGHIPNEFIHQLIASSDIVEVIGKYIPLKKRGANHIACCPFHNEKTPSFSVSQTKQIYHCFGCGVGGNVITFLIEHDHLSFVEAVEELAQIKGQTVPYEKAQSQADDQADGNRDDILTALQDAKQLYYTNIKTHPQRNKAVEYLKERGICGQTAKRFRIGYAPDAWHDIEKQLSGKYSLTTLADAGLVISKNSKTYDRFRNRIMFPIHNRKGQTIAFGGRLFESAQDQPKYLNSPETKVFHKSQELYGLYELKQVHQNPSEILIVEGYMDVVSLTDSGYTQSVATLGTALTESHLKLLFRECSTLVFCFDGDNAGLQASMRTIELVLPLLNEIKTAKFLLLPQDEDPDSLVKKEGLQAFKKRITQALTTPEFFIEQLQKQFDISSANGQAQAVIQIQKLTKNINPAFRESIINLFAQRSGLSGNQIRQLFKQRPDHHQRDIYQQTYFSNIDLSRLPLAHRLLQYLLLAPTLSDDINYDFLADYHSKNAEILIDAFDLTRQYQNTAMIAQQLSEKHPKHQNLFYQLISAETQLTPSEMQVELAATTKALKKYYQQKKLDYLVEKSKLYTLSTDEKQQLVNLLHKNEK